MSNLVRSEYFGRLTGLVRERYLLKIEDIGGLDPYMLKTGFSSRVEAMPPVTSNTIQDYLVSQKSYYTFERFLAKKALFSGEDFVASDKVSCLESRRIQSKFLLRCNVEPSMKSSEKARSSWAIINTLGIIVSAHCDCMAGLAEACSHISAMLFFVVHFREHTELCSVTGKLAYWTNPSHRVKAEMSAIRNIDFSTPKKILHKVKNGTERTERCSSAKYPSPSDEDYMKTMEKIFKSGTSVVAHNVIAPYNEIICANRPKTLKNLYHVSHEKKTLVELRDMATGVDLRLSEQESQKVEEETRSQSKGKAFFFRRIGRASASKFKAICRTSTDEDSVSMSLLDSITDPYHHRFTTKATEYGCNHEKDALAKYKEIMSKKHSDFKMTTCGTFFNPEYPEFIGTPDALVECSCCGRGCCEVKCPYCFKETDEQELHQALEKDLAKHPLRQVLDETTGEVKYELKATHSYYYQVQCQLFTSKKEYSDFVLWTPSTEPIITRTLPHQQFWEDESPKAVWYIRNIVIPELLGKYFTRKKRSMMEEQRQQGVSAPLTGVAKPEKKRKNKNASGPELSNAMTHSQHIHTFTHTPTALNTPGKENVCATQTTPILKPHRTPATSASQINPFAQTQNVFPPATPTTASATNTQTTPATKHLVFIPRTTKNIPCTPPHKNQIVLLPPTPKTHTITRTQTTPSLISPRTPAKGVIVLLPPTPKTHTNTTPLTHSHPIRTIFVPPTPKTPISSKTTFSTPNSSSQNPSQRKPLSTMNLNNIL